MPEEYENVVEKAEELVREQHAEAGRARPLWLDWLAVSTALFAVLAAVASLKAGDSANEALYKSNRAVLSQARASDTWNEFQADSLKKYMQTSNATTLQVLNAPAPTIQAAQQEAARRQAKQDQLKVEAQQRDMETAMLLQESESLLARHSRYALGVTLLQVAIGLSAIAALLRLPGVWWISLLAGGSAIVAVLWGFFSA
ncbi:MAG: DUF4337 family protein [Thermaceae bacterium]|nr:DUF4337 family protein [Thermaceae bacterium]